MNRQWKWMSRLTLLCLFFTAWSPSFAAGNEISKVLIVPIAGEVEPAMAAFVKRAFRDSSDQENVLYVLEMDTFGGRVDSALQIVDTLISDPKRKTVAFVKNKAISAGALIALSCNSLYMRSSTTIGDCAPITYGNEGPKMMGEKFQSPLRAKFRTLARRNGYPETLAESMVTMDMVVYQLRFADKTVYLDQEAYDDLPEVEKEKILSKKTVVPKGELLTMDDVEAKDYGFSQKSVASIEELLSDMQLESTEVVRFEVNWSERMGRFIGMISPILIMIGLAAVYMELKAPGFGIPGIVGICCLALVFLNQYLIGLADHTELLLILLGIGFLAVELFVTPGFGVMGIAGMASIAAGMVLAFQDFVVPDPALPWQRELFVHNLSVILSSYLFAFVFALLFLKYVFPRLGKVVDGPYLATTLKESRAFSEEASKVHAGDKGRVVNACRPSGKAEIRGEIIDVIAEGDFISSGEEIVVLKVEGNRVIVKRSLA